MNPILFMLIVALSYAILYFIIKYTVKNAILQAHRDINKVYRNIEDNDSNTIAKVVCLHCGKKHDMDYPKCPYCDK